ncbi:hypothetical protein FPV67DRAFT_1509855 [Lyophyllum atratum]|nr:hypothetical protein FPV67DRAFT_1509855 [Lyophyllum atratum]
MGPNTRFSSYIKSGLLDTLPVDLKREILETTAYLHPSFAPRLALVSRDVQPWAERIIYRELFFNSQRLYDRSGRKNEDPTTISKFMIAVHARPPAFFAEYVKSLHFHGSFPPEQIVPILQVCTGVTNLGLYATFDGEDLGEIYKRSLALPLHTLFVSTKNLTALFEAQDAAGTGERSTLRKLPRLGLVDGWEYPARRLPALTHLALVPDFQNKALPHVHDALANTRIQSVVVMLNYVNRPKQAGTLQALRDVSTTDARLVMFTLPVVPTRFIEDDLWDLANEFPDEEQVVAYLEEIPGPRILSFQELMELGL